MQEKRWLLTDGLGGYACGNAEDCVREADDALLVAVIRPPLQRRVVVRTLIEQVQLEEGWLPLGEVSRPEFQFVNGMPVFLYHIGDFVLHKVMWMGEREPATYVQYSWPSRAPKIRIRVLPVVPVRSGPAVAAQDAGLFPLANYGFRFVIDDGDALELHVCFDRPADIGRVNRWQKIRLARDGNPIEELGFIPAAASAELAGGENLTLRLSSEAIDFFDGGLKLKETLENQKLAVGKYGEFPPVELSEQMARAAQQFVIQRATRLSRRQVSILSGYPDRTDHGRDMLLALPGILLRGGRYDAAARVLKMVHQHTQGGVAPGRFPETPGEADQLGFDTALWYFHAVHEYWKTSGDDRFAEKEYPFLVKLMNALIDGTENGVKMDAEDGLLYNTRESVARTWMHVRVGNWEPTPRIGKPIEVQALWYNALCVLSELSEYFDNRAGLERALKLAEKVQQSLREKFWREEQRRFVDVLGDEEVDDSFRPNQVVAVGLPFCPFPEEWVASLFEQVDEHLVTPFGLRTLSPDDPAYSGRLTGHLEEDAGAWFNGAVHPWLVLPYCRAALRIGRSPAELRKQFSALWHDVERGWLGHLWEVYEGDPPHRGAGSPASGVSLAAAISALDLLSRESAGG